MKYVLKKELARVFSDKKLVFSIFILPALLMFIIYSLMGNAMKSMMEDIEENVPSIHIVNAPQDFKDLIGYSGLGFEADLKFSDADLGDSAALAEYRDGILEGELELMICFPEDFADKILNYKEGSDILEIPEVKTYYNPAEDYSAEARSRFMDFLESYRQQLLAARVGDINQLTVFTVDTTAPEESVIQKEGASNAKMLSMLLPYLIVFLLFTGPMSLGIDAITGEKERGTMASMLVTPINRSEIVTGKMIAVSILSLITSLIYAGSMIIAVPMMYQGAEEGMDISVNFNIVQIIQIILIMLALVYLYVNLVSIIAVYARNAKEAQSLVMPIYILVMVAGVLTIFGGNSEPAFFQYAIPVYGSAIGIQQLIVGGLEWSEFLVNLGVTLMLSGLVSGLVTRAFNNEKLMFNA